MKLSMNYSFDPREKNKSQLCVEYLLIKRSTVLSENGISKEFGYLAVVGYQDYLKSKSLKQVYVESREIAINLQIYEFQ